MDPYQRWAPPEKRLRPLCQSESPEPPLATGPPPNSTTQWAPSPGSAGCWTSPGYIGHREYEFSFPAAPPMARGWDKGPRLDPPYGFDPSVPPPPFGVPPGHFRSTAPNATLQTCGVFPKLGAGLGAPQYDFTPASEPGGNQQREHQVHGGIRPLFSGPLTPSSQDPYWRPSPPACQPVGEAVPQRRQDAQWLERFLQSRGKEPTSPRKRKSTRHSCGPEAVYRAAELLSALEEFCRSLTHCVEDDGEWEQSYQAALRMKRELQDTVKLFTDGEHLDEFRDKLSRVRKRRIRRLRARGLLRLEDEHRQDRLSEREAAADAWRAKKLREVEERQKEQELKLAADSVLCEVRKKQADIKRMHDILRSLEKLRKLRKEAASRKGIVTEQDCDEAFNRRLEQQRNLMKRRTVVYSAEEKALMVMLEGEQEEERRREQERRVKKERERQLHMKLRVDAMLFGDDLPVDFALQPFREYYSQAQHSLHSLIQIRRDWDVFVVAADNPEGSPVPQSWILPDPPSDQYWASLLQTVDAE